MAESFFASLEALLLARRKFASQAEARMACFGCVDGFYDPQRLHSALGYRSPNTHEEQNRLGSAEADDEDPRTVH